MPSASLLHWHNHRMLRLREIDTQCAATVAAVPPNALLLDENLRGYAVLLSAHFQGFCRDLYTEASQIVASRVRPTLQVLVQAQFSAHRALDHGNPTLDHIARDFDRFGVDWKAEVEADPMNTPRKNHLAALNKWRNVAAHQGTTAPIGIPLDLPVLRAWRISCDQLAASFDQILYNQLRRILGRAPWQHRRGR